MGLIPLLLVGCTDPALRPFVGAAAAYDAGHLAFERGQFRDASAEFAKARTLDPASSTLALWEGRALAASGDLAGAVRAADDAIARDPDSAVAWYNRAAWRARSGDLAPSASDLRRALDLGATTPWAAALDPDFAPHRLTPQFDGVLPPTDLLASSMPPEDAFVGGELSILLRLTGPADRVPELSGPPLPGCLRQTRVVEDDTVGEGASAGTVQRDVRVYFRAVAACEATVGPLRARLGDATVDLAAVPVTVLGPADAPALGGPTAAAWYLPALLHGGASLDGFTIHEGGGRPAGSIALEWRVAHQTRALGWASPR